MTKRTQTNVNETTKRTTQNNVNNDSLPHLYTHAKRPWQVHGLDSETDSRPYLFSDLEQVAAVSRFAICELESRFVARLNCFRQAVL